MLFFRYGKIAIRAREIKYFFNCKACSDSFHNFPDILNGNIWRLRELGLDAIPVIFPSSSSSWNENRISNESYLWVEEGEIQFECNVKPASPNSIRKMPVRRPLLRLPSHPPSSFITRYPSTAHAYEIYKTTRTGAKIWRHIFEGRIRARKRSVAIGSPSQGSWMHPTISPLDTTLTLRLYAPRSQNDQTVST